MACHSRVEIVDTVQQEQCLYTVGMCGERTCALPVEVREAAIASLMSVVEANDTPMMLQMEVTAYFEFTSMWRPQPAVILPPQRDCTC